MVAVVLGIVLLKKVVAVTSTMSHPAIVTGTTAKEHEMASLAGRDTKNQATIQINKSIEY